MGEAAPVRASLIDGLLAALLAPACAACHSPLDYPTRGPVCDRCWNSIGVGPARLAFRQNWFRLDPEGTSPVIWFAALGLYEGSLKAIVHALKYSRRRSIGRRLGRLMAEHAGAVLEGAHAVVPVPLHRSRVRARGFNQAEELARALPLPALPALRRRRRTATQADLAAADRYRNVKGAFRLARGASVEGLVLVLVDDVCTTGATLEACAGVLLEAGAREVRALTAARAVARPR